MNSPPDNPAESNLKQYQERALVIARSQATASLAKKKQESNRDTVEGIVIALIMVFLFRAFVAEAFIIPTGSMAETLYGRHKDLKCEKCNIRFRVGASEEVDRIAQTTYAESDRLHFGYCPNCRYKNSIYKNVPFKGDRIFVNKFPYEFGNPQRFDVVVFKFPEDPKISYIKRLVGLPGEIITISRGDLYQRINEDDPMQILRKPYHKQEELHQLVFDNDHVVQELLKNGFPERWQSLTESDWTKVDPNGWKNDSANRTFSILPQGETKWLRYRHFVPTTEDWKAVEEQRPLAQQPVPLLIADFYSYNSGLTKFESSNRDDDDQL
ncbi:MAG: signal peptidase I, partial [Planctomycetaceae bacterium]|nr:signal peptidase I [Planctomycetaceae bacterium]